MVVQTTPARSRFCQPAIRRRPAHAPGLPPAPSHPTRKNDVIQVISGTGNGSEIMADVLCSRHVRSTVIASIRILTFSLLSLAAITDALACAGRGRDAVEASVFGLSASPVRSGSGVAMAADRALPETLDTSAFAAGFDVLFLLSGNALTPDERQMVLRLARGARLHRATLCAIGTAVRVIVEGGLVTRCTDHWCRIAVLNEVAPSVAVADAIFLSDGNM